MRQSLLDCIFVVVKAHLYGGLLRPCPSQTTELKSSKFYWSMWPSNTAVSPSNNNPHRWLWEREEGILAIFVSGWIPTKLGKGGSTGWERTHWKLVQIWIMGWIQIFSPTLFNIVRSGVSRISVRIHSIDLYLNQNGDFVDVNVISDGD